jgi:hypothetical protein
LLAQFKRFEEVGMVKMDNVTFGITMLVVGMGGTLLTLGIMSLIMAALKKVFPYRKEEEEKS